MSESANVTGPDLRQAIPHLEDGEHAVGQVDGQAVLVVRRGDDYLAVSASCTHYGGPLPEGMIEGDTVRCPWHHACFSLRTGEALQAPALNPITSYEVGKRGWVRYVVGPAPAPPRPPQPAGAPESIVIVGAGAAAGAAAEMLRRLGYAGPITMIGADPEPPYDRPNLSKDYLAGTAPEEWIPLRPRDFWASERIEFVNAEVESIDRQGKRVRLAGGRELGYGRLLLATGAEPIRLPIPGMDGAWVLRSLDDCRRIIAGLAGARRVALLGASFIAMEAAASLKERGLEVTVIAPENVPFERVLGREIGEVFLRLHREKGVDFRLGRKPARIESGKVVLDDGSEVPADHVIAGVGVRPRLDLAIASGLVVDKGVVVDEALRTSDPHVFAAGDIARFPDGRGSSVRVEHWVVAQRQGQTAAHSLLGLPARFDSVPFFWTAQHGLTLRYVGHAEGWDRVDVAGNLAAHDGAVAYRKAGRTLAVATLNRDRLALEAERALAKGDEGRLAKLVPARA